MARLWLRVTGVRVQRVQEISDDDAIAEGTSCAYYCGEGVGHIDRVGSFYDLWNSINAKRGYGWDVNPWVWVYDFRRLTDKELADV